MLLEPFKLNQTITLNNRIVMAPMTRNMADDEFIPTKDMAAYYAKRSDAGLIVSEGTIIRPDGRGYSNTPGIFNQKHIEGWLRVSDEVHEKGGKIFCQIWHVGRVSHPHFLAGQLPIGPSQTTMSGRIRRANNLYYGTNRELSLPELKGLIESFANASMNAIKAGFDGVEIHAANGYLVDQFLHHSTNLREDEYGGDVANMARFALEVIDACINAIGDDRVGIRLSPAAYLNEIAEDKKDAAVFKYLLSQLNDKAIAYVHTGNFDDTQIFSSLENQSMTQFIRKHFRGNLIACGGYSFDDAKTAMKNHEFDLVAIGRRFIANPDLIFRLKSGLELNEYSLSMLNTLD
jgi:N-ethylmaleimide reductase